MNEPWLKLYKKIGEHELLKDHKALVVFILLLTSAKTETGGNTIGRYVGAGLTGMKPGTFYKVMIRLQRKYQVINISSNNKFTQYTICNWKKYQATVTPKVTQAVTTEEHQSNIKVTHTKELRTKNKDNTNKLVLAQKPDEVKEDHRNSHINLILEEFKKLYGHYPIDKQPRRRAWNLIQRLTTIGKEHQVDTSNAWIAKSIPSYFKWVALQETLVNFKNIDVLVRNLPIYIADMEKRRAYATTSN